MATRAALTYRDYEALPADGRRYELHEGELSVTPAPSPRHQEVSINLATLLHRHVVAANIGKVFCAPIDCILSDTTVVQPDIVYVATDRLAAISRRGIEGAPTLAVEILSATTACIDRGVKLRLYARHRVPYCWLVDADARAIDAFVLSERGFALAARLEGAAPVALPPLTALPLAPAEVWRT